MTGRRIAPTAVAHAPASQSVEQPSSANNYRAGRGIELSADLVLPEELVTETVAILGKRGSGKTTTARVLAEGLLAVDLPVTIFDPTGVWWGLRTSADGTADGYPVVIFGGDHGDVPLEETAGSVIAGVIVAHRLSAVLDLSQLSKTGSRRFVADCLETLYQRNSEPRQVMIDEADLFAPKYPTRDTARVLGAMQDLFRRGRVKGLGATAISQRPASLHNDLLGMAEVLITMRMTGVRDVAAIDDWVRLHADEDEARKLKASLPSLAVGTGWLWSPGWLETLQEVNVRRPTTFDSSATPRVGQQRPTVRRMAAVDLAALGGQIIASRDQAQENSPAALRRTVADLRSQLAARPTAAPPQLVEVPVVPTQAIAELEHLLDAWQTTGEQLLAAAHDLRAQLEAATPGGRPALPAGNAQHVQAAPPPPTWTQQPPAPAKDPASDPGQGAGGQPDGRGDVNLPKAQRAILTALAQHGRRSTTQVALLTGYSSKSGGYRNALSALRSAGLIEGRGDLTATAAGLHKLGRYEPLPTGPALLAWWKDAHLGKAERAIVDVLATNYPDPVEIQAIADQTGYSATSGGFRNALSRLRSLELATGRGELQLNPTLLQ